MKTRELFCLVAIAFFVFVGGIAKTNAQTNEFTYQGALTDDSNPADGNYDFRFGLYGAASGGIAIGTRERFSVPVTNGAFTVTLDFPATNFNGSDRFLEIGVRPAGSADPYTVLTPRQRITSLPYAIRSANATNADTAINSTQLGGVAANQFVLTGDPRMTDARNPLPGSSEYIQNNSGFPQTGNFAVSGNGLIGGNGLISGSLTVNGTASASIFNAAMQFNLGGFRFFSNLGTQNTFAGINTGPVNTGANNSFFGFNAGNDNNTGEDNVFVGSDAGGVNTNGDENTFVGSDTGDSNMTGDNNTFIGRSAGTANTEGNNNTFIGWNAGILNTTGDNNTFIGANAGATQTGTRNFSTAIGAGAVANFSNLIVLGRPNGEDDVEIFGTLNVGTLPTGGIQTACITAGTSAGLVSFTRCSSSLRYKTNINLFTPGLNLVNRLKPITFNWKNGGMADLGLGAEDVAEIEPLLVTYNKDGQIEGVKYDRIGVVLVNAVNQQQELIKAQQQQLAAQQKMLERLQREIVGLKIRFPSSRRSPATSRRTINRK
jgi:hypothetical protein